MQWAEDELATAERERERLLTRQVETRAALEDARRLLSHSSEGAEVLRISDRIGALLAAAADEAAGIRAEAEADRSAASEAAQRTVADAERVLAESEVEVQRMVAESTAEAQQAIAEAGRIVDAAEQTRSEARTEAAARLKEIAALELRAAEAAEQLAAARRRGGLRGPVAGPPGDHRAARRRPRGAPPRRRRRGRAPGAPGRGRPDASRRRSGRGDRPRTPAHRPSGRVAAAGRPRAPAPVRRFHLHLRGLADRLRIRTHSPRLP